MIRRSISAAVLAGALVSPSAVEQARVPTPTPTPAATDVGLKNGVTVRGKYVTLVVGSSDVTAAPGKRVSLLVRVSPAPKIHVYAPGQQGYLPVGLSVAPNPAFTARPVVYPASKPYTFAPLGETVRVYSDPFMLRGDIVLAATADLKRRAAKDDTLTIVGALEYQACDDAVCFRPETLPVAWKLKLTGRPGL